MSETTLAAQPGTGSASAWAVARRRFGRDPVALVSLTVVVAMVLAASLGPSLWTFSHTDITPDLSQPPSAAHPFGTDTLGHDMLALVLRGLRQSLAIAFMVALPATLLGVAGGVVAGFRGGLVDNLIMRLVDLILTIPSMALASFLGSRLRGVGISTFTLSMVLAALLWTSMARLVRGISLSIRQELYIDAAILMGASHPRIMARHVLPNVLDQVIVSITLLVGTAVLSESGLSFLGFGIRPPDTSLGLLVSNAKDSAMTRPWTFYFPGLAIIVFVLAINFLGESLRRALNPHRVTNDHLDRRRRRPRADRLQPRPSRLQPRPSRRRPGAGAAAAVPVDRSTAVGVEAAEAVLADPPPLLEIDQLSVEFPAERVRAVDQLSLRLAPGEVVALVGESGSGKTMTVSAVVGLLPVGARLSGRVRFQGRDLTALDYDQWRAIRGSQISIILQDPMTSLNPVLTVFRHFHETMQALSEGRVAEAEVRQRAVELMRAVGITRAEDRLHQYPHELSGGMRQRVVIALAIVSRPQLIIADEPTTALDVTVQARVLDSLDQARASVGAAMVFITHDLALVAGLVDRVLVMKDGRLVEAAPVDDIFARPQHPYTQTLLSKVPRLRAGTAEPAVDHD
ncbi:MAG: dipeptide/oligopeptide/nickel ABC transporter permease/ATP-binding protein [Propionibacteriaceae bacterium]|jgi:peptide/nickel transport system permease protein|nr:dipeptide/oligopeptide/nickel ABC transporter permease/ATP-binding protein [Propionibacteriaceae bacterium]